MSEILALVFDLDGTLYDCPELIERQREVAIEIIRDFRSITLSQAEQFFHKTRQKMRVSLGFQPTTTATCLECGVPLDDYLRETARRYDPADYLTRDESIRVLLSHLKRNYLFGLVSNNNRVQVDRMLAVLGLADVFDASLTLTESRTVKPSPELYRSISKMLGVSPQECVSVGDRQDIDLTPAAEAGMLTVLVSSSAELHELAKRISKIEGRKQNE